MDHEVKIIADGISYETKSFSFPGGELQVQIPDLPSLSGEITVLARLQDCEALLRLFLACEIIDRSHRSGYKRLVIPYLPYARQDRVMQPREAFSLKTIARLINGLGFDEVVTCDPHSDVAAALIDRIEIVRQIDLIRNHAGIGRIIHSGVTVVSPDAGATKKAFAAAQIFGLPLLTASKIRDPMTGAITRTEVQDTASIAGGTALIIDDICDGGRTFIELAKVLRTAGATKVYLYVTHGIFSQGLGVFEGLIDAVFSTDTFVSPYIGEDRPVPLHISNLIFKANGVAL